MCTVSSRNRARASSESLINTPIGNRSSLAPRLDDDNLDKVSKEAWLKIEKNLALRIIQTKLALLTPSELNELKDLVKIVQEAVCRGLGKEDIAIPEHFLDIIDALQLICVHRTVYFGDKNTKTQLFGTTFTNTASTLIKDINQALKNPQTDSAASFSAASHSGYGSIAPSALKFPVVTAPQIREINSSIPTTGTGGYMVSHDSSDRTFTKYETQFEKTVRNVQLNRFLRDHPIKIFCNEGDFPTVELVKTYQTNIVVPNDEDSLNKKLVAKHLSVLAQPALTQTGQVMTVLSMPGVNLGHTTTPERTGREYQLLEVNPEDQSSIKTIYYKKFKLLINAAIENGNKTLIMSGLGMGVFSGTDFGHQSPHSRSKTNGNIILQAFIEAYTDSKSRIDSAQMNVIFSDFSDMYERELNPTGITRLTGDILSHIHRHYKTEDKVAIVNPGDVEQNGQFFINGHAALEERIFRRMIVPPYDVVYQNEEVRNKINVIKLAKSGNTLHGGAAAAASAS